MAGSGGGAAGGAAAAAIAARHRRESLTLSLHHGNPLIDGLVESEVCTSINSSKMRAEVNGQALTTKIHRTLFSGDTAEGQTLDGAKVESSLEPHFGTEEINSLEKETAGSLSGRRHSLITPHAFSADAVDTEVYDAQGKLSRTIHSDMHSSTIDTIVKDAAGRTLRELTSKYDKHLFSADLLCTRLK